MLPRFVTQRLSLRGRTVDDLDACVAMDRAPGVTRFVHGPWHDPVAHRAFALARIVHPYPPGQGYWIITERATGAFVGWILLTPLDLVGPETEVGWRLHPTMWGKGYATEAARPVLDHALVELGLPEVIAEIDRDNTASAAVARKLGMREPSPVDESRRHVRWFARR
jgi:RimJ/RimL family protein N-acetyltransferase